MDIAAHIALRLAYRKRNENQINFPQSMLQEAFKKVGNIYIQKIAFVSLALSGSIMGMNVQKGL